MKVSQVIECGKLTGSYLSSWNNELQLSFGEDKVNMKLGEEELRDLSGRIIERIATIDEERKEQHEAELAKLQEEADAEAEAVNDED